MRENSVIELEGTEFKELTDEQLNSVFNQRGGFSLPSLSTGKTYDELVQEQILSNIVFMDKKMLNFLYK